MLVICFVLFCLIFQFYLSASVGDWRLIEKNVSSAPKKEDAWKSRSLYIMVVYKNALVAKWLSSLEVDSVQVMVETVCISYSADIS